MTNSDYEEIEKIIEFLKPFKTATKYFEASDEKRVTISSVVPVIVHLKSHCKKWRENLESQKISDEDTFDFLDMVETIEMKMDERWEDIDVLFYACSFLEPRFKTLWFASYEKIVETKQFIKSEMDKVVISQINNSVSEFMSIFGPPPIEEKFDEIE